ncbi:Uncharacterised protein [Vibrio cholerae]|nr:Uncharacterised protein [Vibrio cholerae]
MERFINERAQYQHKSNNRENRDTVFNPPRLSHDFIQR